MSADLAKAGFLAVMGLAEGYAFVKVGIISPQAFRDQMEFKSFTVMKLFLSAVGFSMVAQSALWYIDAKRFNLTRNYCITRMGFKRAILGCFTLGAGMYIAGSGPTMMPAQIFGGVDTGLFLLLGSLLGGALFSLVEPQICPAAIAKCEIRESSIDGKLGVSYPTVAIPMGLALIGATVGLEQLFPHSGELARIAGLRLPAPWLPIAAGAVIGLNQVPIRWVSGIGQGGSRSVMNILATISGGRLAKNLAFRSVKDAYQFAYVWIGTGIGALAAVYLAGRDYQAAPGYSPLATVAGAAMMIFGARYAAGCTCGHGISGMSELSICSTAAAMAIFGGGISAGIVKNVAGW